MAGRPFRLRRSIFVAHEELRRRFLSCMTFVSSSLSSGVMVIVTGGSFSVSDSEDLRWYFSAFSTVGSFDCEINASVMLLRLRPASTTHLAVTSSQKSHRDGAASLAVLVRVALPTQKPKAQRAPTRRFLRLLCGCRWQTRVGVLATVAVAVAVHREPRRGKIILLFQRHQSRNGAGSCADLHVRRLE